jgi:hypothetical protein
MTVPGTVRNGQKRSGTVRNGQERSGTVMVTVRNGHGNGQERLGTFESRPSNALERIVESVHGAFTVRSRSRFKNERITVKKFFNFVFFSANTEISHISEYQDTKVREKLRYVIRIYRK